MRILGMVLRGGALIFLCIVLAPLVLLWLPLLAVGDNAFGPVRRS